MKGKKEKMQKGFKPPFSRETPKKNNKDSQPKMSSRKHIHLVKFQGNSMYNVGDVREINFKWNALTKEK
jgi:hypothetical protein